MQTNFNSRPSARGDERKKGKQASAGISIHAPPRGATRCDFSPFELCSISIHAPPRGATLSAAACIGALSYFNSRPSARGDAAGRHDGGAGSISIHAPPRGATPSGSSIRCWILISIHAPPRGATLAWTAAALAAIPFQFTPLREGRLSQAELLHKERLISIHAPPRGATAKDMQFLQIFCSTLTNQHGLTIVPRNLSRLFW